jgi:3-oxoacyl-[acyl-carrier-protein] synthase II
MEVMIAGGAEAPLNFGTVKAWEALKTLATEDPDDPAASCKPFAKDRSGLVLGEGAAMVVLESEDHCAAAAAVHADGSSAMASRPMRPTSPGRASRGSAPRSPGRWKMRRSRPKISIT